MRIERATLESGMRSGGYAAFRFPAIDGKPHRENSASREGSATRESSATRENSASREGSAQPGAEALSAAEPEALLSLRDSGSMRFLHGQANPLRAHFFEGLGVSADRVAAVELVHSREVLWPVSPRELAGLQADGIVVRDPRLVPAVTVADCMPIWLFHRPSGAFGVLHSGWKGTGILSRAVRDFTERTGALPAELSAILGPAIGACCYAVDEARAKGFAEEFGNEAAYRGADGAWRIDLAAANLGLARAAGLGALLIVEACTACDARLGSNRREGAADFTRMLACVGHFPALVAA